MPRLLHCLVCFGIAAFAAAGGLTWAQEAKVEDSYTSLFNGKDLTGWRYTGTPKESLEGKTVTSDGRVSVENGVIVMHEKDKSGKGGIKDLYTLKEFNKDFVVKIEFRAGLKADSGVYVRGPQLQVRDFIRRGEQKQLKKFKNDDWNELEITVRSNVLVTKVNGKPLTDADAFELTVANGKQTGKLNGKSIDLKSVQLTYGPAAVCKCNGEVFDPTYTPGAKGGIGLQAESGKFEFRNIRVKELP